LDLTIFADPQTWITLVTLLFLELALGVDNIVFITITTDRLPPEKRHIGRRLGLAGALIMRIIFLSLASYLVHMTTALFTIDLGFWSHGFSVRDLVLLFGGGYLVYKGIVEQRSMLRLTEQREHAEAVRKAASGGGQASVAGSSRTIGLGQAVGTIMAMDFVFSIDSVITAVGIADHLIVMIIAVIVAILLMMVFIDQISEFINRHAEMKLLALAFITMIGILLVTESLGIATGIEVAGMELEKLIVYCALAFALILEIVQMRYNTNLRAFEAEQRQEQAQELEQGREQEQPESEQGPAHEPTAQVLADDGGSR
jgi:predicted tellurium resistance membrane protein TerC